jgi:hypothetical protein
VAVETLDAFKGEETDQEVAAHQSKALIPDLQIQTARHGREDNATIAAARATGQTTAGMIRKANHTTPAGNPRSHRQPISISHGKGETGERRHGQSRKSSYPLHH